MMGECQAVFAFQKNILFVKSVFNFEGEFFLGAQIMICPRLAQCCKIHLKYPFVVDVEIKFFLRSRKRKSKEAINKTINFFCYLSLVQMKDKMVLSCLKLKQNSFKPLKQSMFTFTTKTF